MTLVADEITEVRRALHAAKNSRNESIPWDITEIETEIAAIDAAYLSQKTAIEDFSAGFSAKSSATDRELLVIAVIAREHLAANPANRPILFDMLSAGT